MQKVDLIKRIRIGEYTQDQLLGWVGALPNNKRIPPNDIKVGDVYMHPIFNHPFMFLEDKDGYWSCTLLTTDETFEGILTKCYSRFFPTSFISTIIFTVVEPMGIFMGVYDNPNHIKQIVRELKMSLL
tara:strand:+ start:2795 stop:3178 length:384 start_codon:yes stop_codon:yes gene_type:complete